MAKEQRLIDANALFDELVKKQYSAQSMGILHTEYPNMMAIVAKQPTMDAVPVVRCKDCKHCCLDLSGRDAHLCMRKEVGFVVRRKLDDFCSYGERKEN